MIDKSNKINIDQKITMYFLKVGAGCFEFVVFNFLLAD